jgi:Xaa-Pro aminopeptidase
MTNVRVDRIRRELKKRHLDAVVISSLPHIRYLTNFSGSNALCIITSRDAHFITDPRYALQSGTEVKGFDRTVTATGLLEAAAKKKLLSGCRYTGFESHYVSYAQYRTMRKLFPRVSFTPMTELVEEGALVKDHGEIALMRQAIKISDRTFHDVLKVIRPGIREFEIAAEISYLQRKYGADRDAFDAIIASGKRGCLPHARPSRKRIKRGELVTLDFGCSVDGYNSDITRTIAIGSIPRRAREMYAVVLEAQLAAIDAAKGGMLGKELDGVARARIKSRGYGKYFTHGLGHGLGQLVHERPRLSPISKERLLAGSVVTIEPGVYVPGYGGVRIEDDVLLTPSGCRVLTKSPKELITLS